MNSRLIHEAHGQRVFAVILDAGDEVTACLERFAASERVTAAQVTAIGAFERVVLAFWDHRSRRYEEHPFDEQCEVLSLLGDVALDAASGAPKLHLHAVLGRRDTTTRGGHLLLAVVRPTLEVIVTEQPAHLCRVHDPATGLALIRAS